jgi:hypothetical protein
MAAIFSSMDALSLWRLNSSRRGDGICQRLALVNGAMDAADAFSLWRWKIASISSCRWMPLRRGGGSLLIVGMDVALVNGAMDAADALEDRVDFLLSMDALMSWRRISFHRGDGR